jgi:hypothetical protein
MGKRINQDAESYTETFIQTSKSIDSILLLDFSLTSTKNTTWKRTLKSKKTLEIPEGLCEINEEEDGEVSQFLQDPIYLKLIVFCRIMYFGYVVIL